MGKRIHTTTINSKKKLGRAFPLWNPLLWISKHLVKVILAPRPQVWFWPSTVSLWNNWYVLSSFLCRIRGREGGKKGCLWLNTGRIFSSRSQAGLWTEAMQTSPQWEPDWKKLGVGWTYSELALLPAEHLIGALMGVHPTWDIGDATSSMGLAASDQNLEHPGLVSRSATNSTCYPGRGNLIPMLPFSVTSALPVCPSPLIKCWTLKAGAVCSYGVSSSKAW